MQDRLDDEDADLSEDGERALQEELDRLGEELEAIEQTLTVYPPGAVEVAGAVVSLDRMGGVVVHRGLLREEQVKALRAQERQEAGGSGEECNGHGGDGDESGKPGISEKLAKRLSAHRTAALQAEFARHPQVAVVHRLALRVILDSYGSGGSSVDIVATPQDGLALHAPDIGTRLRRRASARSARHGRRACRKNPRLSLPNCWPCHKASCCRCWRCAWLPRSACWRPARTRRPLQSWPRP